MSKKNLALEKNNYLGNEHVMGFVKYLTGFLNGKYFEYPHIFSVRDLRGLYPGYEYINRDSGRGGSPYLSINSLKEAFERYWWDGKNFDENNRILLTVKESVQAAMMMEGDKFKNNEACLQVIHEVLKWGAGGTGLRLYTANMSWAHQHSATIAERIYSGLAAIESDTPDLSIFSSNDGPRMNAGFTKLFALASNKSIIYDGRVGAGLGLLARMYCENNKLTSVPESLAFRWSPQTSTGKQIPLRRDPSSKNYVFGQLCNNSRRWVEWNIKANWIISESLNQTSDPFWHAEGNGLRRIEAAIFTLGYNIPDKVNNYLPV